MSNISGIIGSIMNLFGITQVPTTVGELIWTVITLIVGLFIVKYCMLFILELMKAMVKMR